MEPRNTIIEKIHQLLDDEDIDSARDLLRKHPQVSIGVKMPSNVSLLHRFIQYGNSDDIRFLLKNGADPHLVTTSGLNIITILTMCITMPNKDVAGILEVLIDHGFDVLKKNDNGATFMTNIYVIRNNTQAIDLLRSRGIVPKFSDIVPVRMKSRCKQTCIVKLIDTYTKDCVYHSLILGFKYIFEHDTFKKFIDDLSFDDAKLLFEKLHKYLHNRSLEVIQKLVLRYPAAIIFEEPVDIEKLNDCSKYLIAHGMPYLGKPWAEVPRSLKYIVQNVAVAKNSVAQNKMIMVRNSYNKEINSITRK